MTYVMTDDDPMKVARLSCRQMFPRYIMHSFQSVQASRDQVVIPEQMVLSYQCMCETV